MKVCILAIDGLEYNLVKKWRLKGLQQELCGFIDVSNMKTLLTPVIWASFITGEPPEVHGVTSWWSVSSKSSLNTFFHWVRYNIPFIKKVSQWRLREILRIFGMSIRPPQSSDLEKRGLKTIFDYASNPIVIDVPSYNESAEIRSRYSKAMDKGIKNYENVLWAVHKERVNRSMNNIKDDYDLFMAWIDIGDQMGHLYRGLNKMKMMKTYIILERFAMNIKKNLPEDTLFLIVSDHGMEINDSGGPVHSNRAFYSFNFNLGWKPNSIMDYANFIKEKIVKD